MVPLRVGHLIQLLRDVGLGKHSIRHLLLSTHGGGAAAAEGVAGGACAVMPSASPRRQGRVRTGVRRRGTCGGRRAALPCLPRHTPPCTDTHAHARTHTNQTPPLLPHSCPARPACPHLQASSISRSSSASMPAPSCMPGSTTKSNSSRTVSVATPARRKKSLTCRQSVGRGRAGRAGQAGASDAAPVSDAADANHTGGAATCQRLSE